MPSLITHGHEDHIGALPYLLPDLRVPVYATRLTAGLFDVKLREAGLGDVAPLRVFDPDEHPVIPAGAFAVEPFRVCHSIPDAVGFGITTPVGLIVHTSDFKLDPTPIDGKITDDATLRAFDRGVRLLISDCVHVETSGHTPSERIIAEQEKVGTNEDVNYLSRQIRESIASYLVGASRRRPLILPVVLDV